MRTVLFALVFGVAAPALAARSADVLAVVDAAPPRAELAAWGAAANKLSPVTVPPAELAVPTALGKLFDADKLDGVDLGKPLHLVLLNPLKYPRPTVLVVPVANLAALQASAGAAKLGVTVAGAYALVGDEAALRGEAATLRTVAGAAAPKHGVHAALYTHTVWTLFAPQITAAITTAMRQAETILSSTQKPSVLPAGMLTGLGDALLSGLAQSQQLDVDFGVDEGDFEARVAFAVQPNTNLATLFAAQKPSDFGLLPKLERAAPVMMAGSFDTRSGSDALFGLIESMMGKSPELRALLNDWLELASGDFAMAGAVDQRDSAMLFGVRDEKRALALWPRSLALFNRSGMLNGLVKIARTALPSLRYDGLEVSRVSVRYDFTKVPGMRSQADKRFTVTLAATAFDGLLAQVTSRGDAGGAARRLIDSARGKTALTLDAAAAADLARSRAAKDSLWMRLDMSKLDVPSSTATTTPPPQPVVVALSSGFAPRELRLRLRVASTRP